MPIVFFDLKARGGKGNCSLRFLTNQRGLFLTLLLFAIFKHLHATRLAHTLKLGSAVVCFETASPPPLSIEEAGRGGGGESVCNYTHKRPCRVQ